MYDVSDVWASSGVGLQDSLDLQARIALEPVREHDIEPNSEASPAAGLAGDGHALHRHHELVAGANHGGFLLLAAAHVHRKLSAVEGGEHNHRAQGLREGETDIRDQVVPFATVHVVWPFVDGEHQVSRELVPLLVALARERDLGAFLPPRLHLD